MRMELIQPFINAADAVFAESLQAPTKIVDLAMDEETYRRKGIAALIIIKGEIEGRVYAVAYTWRGANRRIISARKAKVPQNLFVRMRSRRSVAVSARAAGRGLAPARMRPIHS